MTYIYWVFLPPLSVLINAKKCAKSTIISWQFSERPITAYDVGQRREKNIFRKKHTIFLGHPGI